MVGQLGRPSTSFVTQLVAEEPGAKTGLTGSGICDFYNEQGTINEANFATLTTIIENYEAEQSRVCAAVANCRTDGGVRADYTDTIENFTDDFNHLNVAGQAVRGAADLAGRCRLPRAELIAELCSWVDPLVAIEHGILAAENEPIGPSNELAPSHQRAHSSSTLNV